MDAKQLTLAFIGSIIGSVSISAFASSLAVRAEPPDAWKIISDDPSWNILLNGEIDPSAPERVAAALNKAGTSGADIYVNSPGGDVLAALKIG